jgi:hypothetical protein
VPRTGELQALLGGEAIERPRVDYDFDGHHLGLIATGPLAEETLRRLARDLERRLLLDRFEKVTSGWLGGERAFETGELGSIVAHAMPGEGLLAIGEPGHGIEGWRLTHRQARAAFALADGGPSSSVRYGDVAVLAAVCAEGDLSHFLRRRFLSPLKEAGGGESLLATLRLYLASGCEVSATAIALGVPRRVVEDRLELIETRIEAPIDGCLPDLDLAMRLEALGA